MRRIGGLAVGIRSGVPRATLDVDVAVSTTTDRSFVTELLVSAGFKLVGQFAHSINFKHESGEPVQLAFDRGFDSMIGRAEPIPLDELSIPVVTKIDPCAHGEQRASRARRKERARSEQQASRRGRPHVPSRRERRTRAALDRQLD